MTEPDNTSAATAPVALDDSAGIERAYTSESPYLRRLRRQGRTSDLAARITLLREHGWEMTRLAEELKVSRQWLYQIVANHPQAKSPSDAPKLYDMRPPPDYGLYMRQDLADVPASMCAPLQAMWAHIFRDKSGGSSPNSVLLDVTIALLLRRGVPYVRIATCGNVTHRAASERMRRAKERGTLPAELDTSFLSFPTKPLPTPRTAEQINDPRRQFAIVQVVAASFIRFYTLRLRKPEAPMFTFDPVRQPKPNTLAAAGLGEFTVINDEKAWVHELSNAAPDASPLYAVPLHLLYTSSMPHIWRPEHYEPAIDFYPEPLRPNEDQLRFFTEPEKVIREADPIAWGGRR
jgi:hypothetical protein